MAKFVNIKYGLSDGITSVPNYYDYILCRIIIILFLSLHLEKPAAEGELYLLLVIIKYYLISPSLTNCLLHIYVAVATAT